jgi:competence protein ComEA
MPEPVSPRNTIIAFAIVAIMIAVGVGLVLSTRPQPVEIVINPPVPTATALPTNTPAPILVYVTGAVQQPEQTVTLPKDSRVQDALALVGGTTEDADLSAVNLAGILRDGDQIFVPSKTQASLNPQPTALDYNIVYINTATLDELMTLPNIGESTAQAIIAFREANGGIRNAEELDSVEGIGEKTLEELLPFVSFE